MAWLLRASVAELVLFSLALIAICFVVVAVWDRVVWGNWDGFFGEDCGE